MNVRTVDLERARAAAATELAGVERLTDTPAFQGPPEEHDDVGSAMPGRDSLEQITMLMLAGASQWAAQRWGSHWEMKELEARALATPLLDVIELEMGQLADDPYSRLLLAASMFAIPRALVTFMGGGAPPAAAVVETKPLDINATGATN